MTGPQSSFNAAEAVKQTCQDLADSYAALAQHGRNVLGNIDSVIGRIKQYKYTVIFPAGYTTTEHVEYRDDPYAWWEKLGIWAGSGHIQEEIVDHPRQQEARKALAETQGIVNDVDNKFELDAEDMRDTVASIAEHMSGWVETSSKVSELIFPSSATQVPTSGDLQGWRSPTAKQIYDDNIVLQHKAHETTAEGIEAMLSKEAEFVGTLGNHLASFANLERDNYQYYSDLATETWIPEEWDIQSIIKIIGEIGDKAAEFKRLQIEELERTAETLNSAVTTVLAVESQKNVFSRLSEPTNGSEVGWPSPANTSGRSEEGSSDFDTLKFNTQYFKDHVEFWQDLSDDFAEPIAAGEGSPPIKPMFLRMPSFTATPAMALNDLAEHIVTAALRRGQIATKELSAILRTIIKTYLEGEELNAEEASKLERMLDQ